MTQITQRAEPKEQIRRYLEKRGWELVSNFDRFATRVLAAAQSRASAAGMEGIERNLERETIRLYSSVLYQSLQVERSTAYRRVLEELWTYLFPLALYKTRDEELAKECIQRTLIKVWQKHDQCSDPERFLGWAKVVLLNEIRMYFREEKGAREIPETDLDIQETQPGEQILATLHTTNGSQRPLENGVVQMETVQRLRDVLRVTLHSEAQSLVIEGLFIHNMGVKAMAETLGTNPSNVYVLKSRALKRLRQDEQFVQLLAELVERGSVREG
jgi:RNA polymerase sigma factor (sigma-70 family)